MAHTVYGDLNVKRTINADRRVNQGLSKETISSERAVTVNDYSWLQIINASTQDVVLPDATTLTEGWSIVVMADASSGASLNVKTYHTDTPVLLINVLIGRAYRFTLLDDGDSAGTWHVDYLEESDKVIPQRYIETFNATTDWSGPSGGYYSLTVSVGTHEMGLQPTVSVREGTDPYIEVLPDQISVAATGDITIRVTQTPDLRFAGQMIIM